MTRGVVMPAVFAFAVASAAPRAGRANCMESAHARPEGQTLLPLNGRIVLEAGLEVQAMVTELRSYRPELRANGDRVPLRVLETNVGVKVTQAMLAPERGLRPNLKYALAFTREGKLVAKHPRWYTRLLGNPAWKTAAEPDTTPPQWRKPPRAGTAEYTKLGCGPDSYVPIEVSFVEPDPLWVRLDLQTGDDKQPRRYLVPPRDGVVQVGRTMCGGAFDLAPGTRYLVTLTAVDFAGNEAPAPGPPIEIIGPGPVKTATKEGSAR